MVNVSPLELDHCRELALLPGSVFEFTSRFLATDQAEPLLALYALRQAVSSIPYSAVDDEVKWAKLKWWSEEFAADPESPSRHPVLRALHLTGARAHIGNDLLQRMIRDAITQIDIAPDGVEEAMFERLSTLGSTDIQLELSLTQSEISSQNLKFLAAASGLFQLISSFAAGQHSEPGRLPLYMLAEHNVSAAQLERETPQTILAQIIGQLAAGALDWFSEGMQDLEQFPKPGGVAHLQLRWAMERRRLTAISKDTSGFLGTGKHYGPSDAWFAWRLMRRLR